jgi:lysophospholipase L1-like esterase
MNQTTCDRTIRILFAGGCQVSGYPGDEQHGFPVLVSHSLRTEGAKVQTHTLAYLRLAHRRRLIAKCKETQPDVLVLQLGHFELNNSLSSYLRTRLRRPRPCPTGESSSAVARQVDSAGRFYIKAAGKRFIDVCLRHPLVDFHQLQQRREALIADIEKLNIPSVVILSPLPAADPTVAYYRRRALPLFHEIAAEHGYAFIDVLSGSPAGFEKRFGLDCYHYDGIHMGELGQMAISTVIASSLRLQVSAEILAGTRPR